ncbi:MAG: chorismate mutase [Synergistaceae bacterium]|jgi:chorismate mutase/prephenate dehydratase|nr:chorismate mutase [Synergistaceae bacterium]
MNGNAKLNALRERIDEIDRQLVPLFEERMGVSLEIAEVKVENNAPIQDEAREREVVEHALALANHELKSEVSLLMRSIIALSRTHQRAKIFHGETPMLPPARELIRENVTCAFQGVPGAWSEQASIKLFPDASRLPVEFFEDVFLAVKENRVHYGVVAIENSQTGAIGETYDLLRKYGCFIVGRTWVDIRQCLLASAGTALSDIREVLSHSEGFKQCARFLRGRSWDLTASRNTAVAAKTIAQEKGGNGRRAAIGSRRAAELNGLEVLVPDIMDSTDNRTSFVVIATAPEYDETSNLVSVTFSTEHRAGALCEALMPFMAQGINLVRIESRPASGGSYRFFVELDGNILDPGILSTLKQASAACQYFEVIGCYKNT